MAKKKVVKKRVTKRKKKKGYFTKVHQEAIVEFCKSDCPKEKERLYTDIIREALEKLSENLIYVYGFHKQHDNVDVLKQDCVINLYETLHKFDMYVANWRFFDACAWFRPRTVASAHKDSVGYLFWEGFDQYNFKSVDTLFNQTPYPANNIKYAYAQANATISDTQRRIKKICITKSI